MSSANRWGDSRGLASTLLSLVRPHSSPAKDDDALASSEAPAATASSPSRKKHKHKHKHRKRRDQPSDGTNHNEDDAMTTASQELPPLRNDEPSQDEADFGALQMFDSNATQAPASSQAVDASGASKKSRRDKKKDRAELPSNKSQRRSSKYSSSLNGNVDGEEPAATPNSPSRKKRKNSDSSDGKDRKKRKSQAGLPGADATASSRRRADEVYAIDSIPEENADPAAQESPSAARARRRSQSREARSREGSARPNATGLESADVDDIDRDVQAYAREAWQQAVGTEPPQQDTEMADAAPAATEAADETTNTPRRARSTRKKAKPTYFEQPVREVSLDAFGNLPSPSAMTPKPRRAKRAAPKKGSRRQRKVDRENGLYGDDYPGKTYTQGKFSDEELSRIAHAIESFRAENDMEQREVNEMIQAAGGTSAGEAHAQLWMRVFAECPDRHRQKVINIARKKFHNFVARGTWTIEQDNELASLINTHGAKWSYIAGIINRHPEDIRDRYRNYLVCGGAQKKEAWNNDEEARLTQFVQEAMQAIDELRVNDPSKELLQKSYEELIDWQNISERMERTRSRLQCITKWKSMNMRIHSKDKLVSADPDSNISFRLEKARRQLEDMPETEKYRLVLAINASAAGTTAKIPWQKLCDKQFRSTWHRSTQELVWYRLKLSVPGADMRTVRDCAQYLVDKYDQDGELPNIGGAGFDDDDEMALMAQVPFGLGKDKSTVSSEKLSADDLQGDEEDAAELPAEMQIDPALSEVPQSAKKATPAKRTQNGKRPSARKPKKPVEQIEEAAEDGDEAEDGNADEIDESSHRKRKTPSKFKKGRGSKAAVEASSDMDDMEDLPSRVAA